MLHLNHKESNSIMEASNNNITNEKESVINITQEFRGLLSKMEFEFNQVKTELKQVKKEIKEIKENEIFNSQKNIKKKVSFIQLMKCPNTFELSIKIQNQTKIIESGIGTKVGISLSTIAQFLASFII